MSSHYAHEQTLTLHPTERRLHDVAKAPQRRAEDGHVDQPRAHKHNANHVSARELQLLSLIDNHIERIQTAR